MTRRPTRTGPARGTRVVVRRGSPSELGAVAALAARVLPEAGDAESLARHVERPAGELWVAALDAALLGFLVALRVGSELEVLWIGVDAEARREGVGRRMLERALDGGAVCHLEVRANHREAQAFYRHCGFVEVGRRPAYYPEGEDALLLRWAPGRAPHG